jgi:hypothetical protein
MSIAFYDAMIDSAVKTIQKNSLDREKITHFNPRKNKIAEKRPLVCGLL